MPAIEAGRLLLLGYSEPATLEKVLQQRPRLRVALSLLPLEPMPAAEARALAAAVMAREAAARGLLARPGVVDEALELARHYLGTRALPGSVLDLLRGALQRRAADPAAGALDRADLLAALGELSGLPREVLDERAGLSLAALRAHFEAQVMGQPEAVQCLVDRIAMLKAGLVDPNRPIGVFLFAGPTGTGKTEVARTLAAFLFGSPERMVRLDMSELQDPGAIGRIVGEPGDAGASEALTSRIRAQPFSVVLLDEFEKAHPRIWDLFLQVFDDGRLTDAQGGVADFRHAIVIMTTNLGATAHRGSSLGFIEGGGAYGETQVLRAIATTFRPEFVNRIDRAVVFRPLSRAVMRDILRKELRNVLQRRGFRSREWAVEWEDSAIEFLLDKGFTPDMGARPLRRAIDQHVLAPIAMTIVEHRFPEGDQFLFVKSDGQTIQVEFVDPDAHRPEQAPPAEEAATQLSWGQLVLAPRGTAAERDHLRHAFAALDGRLGGELWHEEKQALLESINGADFWTTPERHTTLDRLERMDRIQAGLETARSLARRLEVPATAARGAPASVLASLALQLYLLDAALRDLDAGRASDVYVAVEPVMEGKASADATEWAARIAGMYASWARRRRMRLTVLSAPDSPGALLAIGGFGVHGLLERETGLHVLEAPGGDADLVRHAARVRVVAQPVAPAPLAARAQAQAVLAAAGAAPTAVVRRYRRLPSPLVRDAVAGWRTGRLDLVLGGDFDLMR
jgi:ATP-dependent Clp protease ATP-binding subunit ClpC